MIKHLKNLLNEDSFTPQGAHSIAYHILIVLSKTPLKKCHNSLFLLVLIFYRHLSRSNLLNRGQFTRAY